MTNAVSAHVCAHGTSTAVCRASHEQVHQLYAILFVTMYLHTTSLPNARLVQVEELKANRARKLKARAKYEQYVQQQQKQAANGAPATGAARIGAVDYVRWDLWCPSDEEDEIFSSLTPNNPGFRAMERDINERHKRCPKLQRPCNAAHVFFWLVD